MAVGGRFIASAWATLSILRDHHHCALPIELWYLDDDDFPERVRQLFQRFDVRFIDVRSVRGATWLPHSGWELKPFAVAQSQFAEVLLLDADNIPLADPAALFDDPHYSTHGALFWPDVRPVNPYNPIWAIIGVTPPSGFEHESGQMLVDKRRHWAGVQLAEHFVQHSSFYFQYILGDKESMHLAWRMLKAPCASPATPAAPVVGHFPGDAEDASRPIGLWQHDFNGRRLFLHMTDVHLIAWGRNLPISGFGLEREIDHALATLRDVWDGEFPALPVEVVSAEANDSTPPGTYVYIRRGLERRVMGLLANGRIGAGADQTETFWRLEDDEQGQALILAGREKDTCVLRRQEGGHWTGWWFEHEQTPVELRPISDSIGNKHTGQDLRPRLLFISPVEPKDAGNGLAMRAANMLRMLVDTHRVSLLIATLYGSGASKEIPGWVFDRCEHVRWARQPARNGPAVAAQNDVLLRQQAWIDEARRSYWGERFDVIYLFRLSTLSFAAPYLTEARHATAEWHLDLDDVESRTSRRLAALFASSDRHDEAARSVQAAQMADSFERRTLRTWDRVYVCSEQDKRYLEGRVPERRAEIVAIPNRVRLPTQPPAPPHRKPFTILYVGTLDYFPNQDGAIWFCRSVIPAIRESSSSQFRLLIVGTGASSSVRELGLIPEVEVVGEVPSIDEWYERADMVVVPIRAGGGTRIKLLEALAFERPVVATRMAAEGLDVIDREHLLLADRPIPFARCCLELMNDPQLAGQISRNGRRLIEARYALDATVTVSAVAR